jgi:hypothetical protein
MEIDELVIVEEPVPEESASEEPVPEEPVPEVVEAVDFDSIGLLIAEAQAKREEIDSDGIAGGSNGSDAGNDELSAADKALAEAQGIYSLGPDGSDAKEKLAAAEAAKSALDAYNHIFETYWLGKADEARTLATSAQQDALKIKADVAVRDDYLASADIFNNGETLYKAKNYKASVNYFVESEGRFVNAALLAGEKRRMAALALQSAERKIEESERIAADADSVLSVEQGEEQL